MPQLKEPLVTIALPVYNGYPSISKAIKSILNQTYKNFELIISDNKSTDKTVEIANEFAKDDPRIIIYVNAQNIGLSKNFYKTITLASKNSKYFMFHAHDDLLDKSFLKKSVKIMEDNSNIILTSSFCGIFKESISNIIFIDKEINTLGLDTVQRAKSYREIIHSDKTLGSFYLGLRRKSKNIFFKPPNMLGSDNIELLQLSFLGEFFIIPEILMFKNLNGISKDIKKYINNIGKISFFAKYLPYALREFYFYKVIISSKKISKINKFYLIYISFKDYLFNNIYRDNYRFYKHKIKMLYKNIFV